MNTTHAQPRQRHQHPGDTPQEVLFIVTDGVVDEVNRRPARKPLTGTRCQEPITPSLCTAIKNRGIRIAVLYTTICRSPATHGTRIGSRRSSRASRRNCKACASTGLFYQAAIGEDLGAALSNLFEAVTQTAHLTQ